MRGDTHLSDARLFDCHVAERGGEGIAPPAAEHLADCDACRSRYADLTRFMDTTWADADAETSAVFTPERLHQQQLEIARRLELLGHPGRVISFPSGADAAGHDTFDRALQQPRHATRVATRWTAAAAAAGLVIGVGVGIDYNARTRAARAGSAVTAVTPVTNVPGTTAMVPPPALSAPAPMMASQPTDQTVFMAELEAALDRPRTRELRALDALTPHVREIQYRIR